VGVKQEEGIDRRPETANSEHGAYALHHYESYLGEFYAYRRSFTFPGTIIRSLYRITWSEERECLIFEEDQKYHSTRLQRDVDHSQSGEIYISNVTSLLHLLTKFEGALRLVTLARLDPEKRTMGGIVLTQAKEPFYYKPSVSPICLRKIDQPNEPLADGIRGAPKTMTPNDPDYAEASQLLIEVEQTVAGFALRGLPPIQESSGENGSL
jgi:hypothetical protein